MPDGLANVDEGAGKGLKLGSDLVEDHLAGTPLFMKLDIKLVHADRHDVVIAFRSSGSTPDALHFGDALKQPYADLSDVIGLSQ